MMAVSARASALIDRLPAARGTLVPDAPLSKETWFRVGGPADVLFRPADVQDLADFLAGCPKDVPVTVVGVGSNLLVRDGGVRGVVVRMGKELSAISVDGDVVRAEAGAQDLTVAAAARDAGLAGLEFLSGIPGTVGGALRMNAGAYGAEVKDVFVEAEALDRDGGKHRLDWDAMGFEYRHVGVPDEWIFVSGAFRGLPGDKDKVAARMKEIRDAREGSQPMRVRTGGSTFRNPPGTSAWKLVDEAGCRGLQIGGARVSDLHTNFLLNTGEATATDIEALGEEVRRRVRETSGVELVWEIRRIGEPQPGQAGGTS